MIGFMLVGLGGAAGAMLRYAVSLIPFKGTFPLLTLLTNVCGAVLIGYIAGAAQEKGMSQSLVLLLKTGLCGGFTTFSTFSLEAYNLLEKGHLWQAGIYAFLSMGLCLAGIWCGMALARTISR